jgi:hypothetical protein
MKKSIVITTISKINKSLEKFSKTKYDLVIIGDTKSPSGYDIKCTYLNIAEQKNLFPDLCKYLKLNHYSRKNIGYLYCYLNKYDIIAESDDDNFPYKNWGTIKYPKKTISSPKIINVYKLFTDKKIWPRGYPLELILSKNYMVIEKNKEKIMVMQSLVDGDADTDAIYRLTIGKKLFLIKTNPMPYPLGFCRRLILKTLFGLIGKLLFILIYPILYHSGTQI